MDEVRRILQCLEPGVTGRGVRVAVIDTGVDPEHPDLSESLNLAESRSFLDLTSSIVDLQGHGTHIAGIIAGSGACSDGRYAGIAPGAELIVLRALDNTGSGFDSAVAKAVEYAITKRVDIINYSSGEGAWRKLSLVGSRRSCWSSHAIAVLTSGRRRDMDFVN